MPLPLNHPQTANIRRRLQEIHDAEPRDATADDCLWIVATELEQLDVIFFRDVQTRQPHDAVGMLLGTWIRSARSEPKSVLTLPEGVLAPNHVAPEGSESVGREIACHL